MILAEQLVLLSLDPERGSLAPGIAAARLRRAAAAALLLDLLLAQRIVPREPGLAVIDAMPSYHPLLTEAQAAVRRLGTAAATTAITAVQRSIRPLLRRILANLADRDLLHAERHRLFWRRYPVRSMLALSEVFDRIHDALGPNAGAAPLLLLGLADAAAVLEARLTPEERARAALRLAQPLVLPPPLQDNHRRLARALLDAARQPD